MANTYKIIDKVILTGSQTSVSFTGLGAYSSDYTDLKIVLSTRTNEIGVNGWINGKITFNGSTSGYSGIALFGRGDLSPASLNNSSTSIDFAFYSSNANTTANTFSNCEIYIPNYSSSNYKSVSSDYAEETNAARALLGFNAGLWSNTAAITSIALQSTGGDDFQSGSSFYLYGIKKN